MPVPLMSMPTSTSPNKAADVTVVLVFVVVQVLAVSAVSSRRNTSPFKSVVQDAETIATLWFRLAGAVIVMRVPATVEDVAGVRPSME